GIPASIWSDDASGHVAKLASTRVHPADIKHSAGIEIPNCVSRCRILRKHVPCYAWMNQDSVRRKNESLISRRIKHKLECQTIQSHAQRSAPRGCKVVGSRRGTQRTRNSSFIGVQRSACNVSSAVGNDRTHVARALIVGVCAEHFKDVRPCNSAVHKQCWVHVLKRA